METEGSLRAEVRELRLAVLGFTRLLEEQDAKVAAKVETEVRDKAVPREELTQRLRASGTRTVAGLVLVVILALAAVGANRLTLLQAQRQGADDLRMLVQTCRTTAPTLTRDQLAYCERRIPGFGQARKRAADLAVTARRVEERLTRLERKVARRNE